MRRLLGRWPATLLLTMLGAGSALADTTVGAWTVGPYEGTLPTRCVATNASDENGGVLIGMVADLGVIQFVVKSPRLRLSRDDKVEAEVLIDGRSIALSAVTTLDGTSARFEGLARGREDGSLLRGVERGARAVVQMTGQRFTFDLAGTSKAMALLSRCVIDPSVVASPSVAERDLEAADDIPDDGDGDVGGSASAPAGMTHAIASPGWERRPWSVMKSDGQLPADCVAGNSEDNQTYLMILLRTNGLPLEFAFGTDQLRFSGDDAAGLVVKVDGRSYPLTGAYVFNDQILRFKDASQGEQRADLLHAMEAGLEATIEVQQSWVRFDLKGTREAVARLRLCGEGREFATPGALSAQRDTTDKFEQLLVDKAKEAAGWAKPSAGAATADDSTSADALGRAMQDVTTDAAPVAQFQCEVASDDLFGLRGLGSGRYQAPTAMTITVGEDGRAIVNGKILEPVKVDRRASLRSVGYAARDVLRATLGSVGTRAPLYGMTAEQLEAYQFATNAFAGVSVDLVGANRFMVVGVASGVVSFLDVESDGSITNQRTPVCLKTQ